MDANNLLWRLADAESLDRLIVEMDWPCLELQRAKMADTLFLYLAYLQESRTSDQKHVLDLPEFRSETDSAFWLHQTTFVSPPHGTLERRVTVLNERAAMVKHRLRGMFAIQGVQMKGMVVPYREQTMRC